MKDIIQKRLDALDVHINKHTPDLLDATNAVMRLEEALTNAVKNKNKIASVIKGFEDKKKGYIEFLQKYEEIEAEENPLPDLSEEDIEEPVVEVDDIL